MNVRSSHVVPHPRVGVRRGRRSARLNGAALRLSAPNALLHGAGKAFGPVCAGGMFRSARRLDAVALYGDWMVVAGDLWQGLGHLERSSSDERERQRPFDLRNE
jgi:hypothetical protein